MINYDFIYYRMLYLRRICASPTLLNIVILLFNLVKNWGRLIHRKSKNGYFVTTKWGVDLYTATYGMTPFIYFALLMLTNNNLLATNNLFTKIDEQ